MQRSKVPILPLGQVHIWSIRPSEFAASLAALRGTLSKQEEERSAKFYIQEQGDAYLIYHGVLRLLLGAYLGTSPNAVEFGIGKHGKPHVLDQQKGLSFNLSHTKGLGLIAIARSEVGVDVEVERKIKDPVVVARRFFSDPEANTIQDAPTEAARLKYFLTSWTRREALIKGLGTGFVSRPQGVDLSVCPTTAEIGDKLHHELWHVTDLSLEANYKGALAVNTTHQPMKSPELFYYECCNFFRM